MKKKKVLLGMSGGIDSSVAGILLNEKSFEVTGIFFRFHNNFSECEKKANNIAKKLGIKFYVCDLRSEFKKKVVDYFLKSYKKGLTPNPCIVCNKKIKFKFLLKKLFSMKADFIATGHYAKIRKIKNKFELFEGKDKRKDQSYFLHLLGQEELSRIIFPLGNCTKKKVNELAKKYGFSSFGKSSQDICFINQKNIKKFLSKKIKKKKGYVLDVSGKVIGSHSGAVFFTIGERIGESKGVKLKKEFAGKKLYVAEKTRENQLLVAPKGHALLKRKKIFIKELCLINPQEKVNGKKFKARIRHLGELHEGKLLKKNFEFSKAIEGVASGQSIVFYSGKRVVGGGEIQYSTPSGITSIKENFLPGCS